MAGELQAGLCENCTGTKSKSWQGFSFQVKIARSLSVQCTDQSRNPGRKLACKVCCSHATLKHDQRAISCG
ncbi:hypothetical protein M758_9G077500 [Ceratodon purpureus]|nr:hypothetical protein M758_11G096000 [Ceratodon purpureus]KAG0605656.1 hypothetical protein M758_9G077500 [Ceratodon purpureus]